MSAYHRELPFVRHLLLNEKYHKVVYISTDPVTNSMKIYTRTGESLYIMLHCGIIEKKTRGFCMEKNEFSQIRRRLGKTQVQMAQLLSTSLKAIQSFEQGWRNIPVHIERQVFFLLAKHRPRDRVDRPCWVILECPAETRRHCPAWEFQSGDLCWFINGTICQGKVQGWQKKISLCRQCKVFQPILSSLS